MPLTRGQSLTHYEILGPLGAGGMGEVYRARDTRLEREVAIKVLPEHFADDEERLRRFEREAKTLASLNHPNVAGIHGIDQIGDTCFLAMELVEGEDLAARLARGPLPVDDAVDLGRQIAEGLEAAHEAGVVHRDLKPANVRVTPAGIVKVLDFGLAKPIRPRATKEGTTTAESDSFLVTEDGLVLGTPTYMSPEQARGKPVDRRTDIWAFGCVLFECLTGERAFGGDSLSDVIAAVLERQPDLDRLPATTPPRVRELVARCLTKDPRQRLRDVGEARVLLERPYDRGAGVDDVASASSRVPWLVAAVAAVVAIASIGSSWSSEASTSRVLRSEIGMVPRIHSDPKEYPTLLSGGHRILFAGEGRGGVQLYLRDLSELNSRPVAGTENAELVGVSPDERWYAFIADNALKKISVNGGDPIQLAETTSESRGGSWGEDGYIYYVPGTRHPIMRVPEDGGAPEQVTEIFGAGAKGVHDNSHRWPTILPGGKALLYLAGTAGDFAGARVEVRELDSGEVRVLQTGAMFPRYFDGHVGYIRDGALYVQGFDVETLTLTTPPVRAVDDVVHQVGSGSAQYTVSDNGTLLYVPGVGMGGLGCEMKLVAPDSIPKILVGGDAIFHPRFSPDGGRIAYTVGLGAESDVWIHDVETGQDTRLTLDSRARDMSGAWSPDGTSIVFASNRDGGAMNLYLKPADGSGGAVRLTESEEDQYPTSWSSDGKMLLFMQATADRATDVHLMRLDGNARPIGECEVLESSLSHDVHAVFSPDGKLIAYGNDESGRLNVFVRGVEGTARWQITDAGGWAPSWADDGRLYFQVWEGSRWQGNGKILAVDFELENGTRVPRPPIEIVDTSVGVVQLISATFDVHPTEERFVVIDTEHGRTDAQQNPVLIQNWLDDFVEREGF